jgi:hypothetical protein
MTDTSPTAIAALLDLNSEGKWHFDNTAHFIKRARDLIPALAAEHDAQQLAKDAAYLERNKLVALLASVFPSGKKRTEIRGWSDDWHGCVYIDFPWGQASWHYHDSQEHLFSHLQAYEGEWDGHTTDQKYAAIVKASKQNQISAVDGFLTSIRAERDALAVRVAELEARALLDGIAMTKTAIDRDKAIESRDHWRQKAGR